MQHAAGTQAHSLTLTQRPDLSQHRSLRWAKAPDCTRGIVIRDLHSCRIPRLCSHRLSSCQTRCQQPCCTVWRRSRISWIWTAKTRCGLPRARKVKVKTLSRHTPDPYSPCTDTSTRAHAALPYNICSMEVSENAASASDPGSCEQIRRRRRGPYVAGCRYWH